MRNAYAHQPCTAAGTLSGSRTYVTISRLSNVRAPRWGGNMGQAAAAYSSSPEAPLRRGHPMIFVLLRELSLSRERSINANVTDRFDRATIAPKSETKRPDSPPRCNRGILISRYRRTTRWNFRRISVLPFSSPCATVDDPVRYDGKSLV
jgi:hypothetical protein